MTNPYIHRTLIVTAAIAPTVRQLVTGLAGDAADGMFSTGLSPTGNAPATHYVSSGAVGVEFELALADAVTMQAMCAAGGIDVPLALCQGIVAGSTVVDLAVEDVHATLARLGLKLVQEEVA